MKKKMSIALVLVMMLTLIPTAAFAANDSLGGFAADGYRLIHKETLSHSSSEYWDYTYDESGRLKTRSEYFDSSSDYVDEYGYSERHTTVYNYKVGDVLESEQNFIYSQKGNMESPKDAPIGNLVSEYKYIFDDTGRIVSKKYIKYNEDGSIKKEEICVTFEYNGDKVRKTEFNSDGTISFLSEEVKDNRGNLIRYTSYDKVTKKPVKLEKMVYNDNNKLVRKTFYDRVKGHWSPKHLEKTYYKKGDVVVGKGYDRVKGHWKQDKYEGYTEDYNSKNLLVKRTSYKKVKNKTYKCVETYTYDNKGVRLGGKEYYYKLSGSKVNSMTSTSSSKLKYDGNGNLISEEWGLTGYYVDFENSKYEYEKI